MAFDVDAVARRFAAREGCRFVGYTAVGIAVFDMNVRALAIEARDIAPIDAFILRFIAEGVEQIDSLSGLLGLDQELVRTRLVELRRDELINVSGSGAVHELQLELTSRGHEVAQTFRKDVMQEITVPHVYFHGFLWQPVRCGQAAASHYLKPKEAKDGGFVLIRAIPNRYPYPEEIDVERLDHAFKHARRTGKGTARRDIVAVKSVLTKVHTVYEPAVMLEYETTDERRERQIAFVVDGQLREGYEKAFARGRGADLLSELLAPRDEPLADRIRRAAPQAVVSRLGDLHDVETLATEAVAVRQQLDDACSKFEEEQRVDTRQLLRGEIERLQERLTEVERQRAERKVEYLWTPEIKKKLWEALDSAQERLLIMSGFISSEVVDAKFVAALRAALQRGVRVWIGYGFGKNDERGKREREKPSWVRAEAALQQLRKEFRKTFTFRDVGESHDKRLICDNRFTLGGSFNFLSFTGERHSKGPLRHEGADLIKDEAYCACLYDEYIEKFFRGD